MKEEKLKMLQVRETTHKEIKRLALEYNMSIKDFIDFIMCGSKIMEKIIDQELKDK